MKLKKLYGAIHAFMFCAFFISFLFRTDGYLLRRMATTPMPVLSSFFTSELLAFVCAAGGFLWLAFSWNMKMVARLLWIISLTVAALGCYFFYNTFSAFILIIAALCTALPYAVDSTQFKPQRLFFAFLGAVLAACFPDIGIYAGLVVLIIIFAQREIPGIRFTGRFILACLLLTALLFGAFPFSQKYGEADISPEQYRKDYEMMMLAFAQYGSIPQKTLCFFNHPLRSINELSIAVLKLSVDKNENMTAYFAGDQLRYSAEYDLETNGKTPQPPLLSTAPSVLPPVVLVSYPASRDFYRISSDQCVFFNEDGAWRNHSFYTVEWLQKQKKQMAKNGVLALQLPEHFEQAASILAAIRKVYKNTVILRWSGVYVFASDRPLTDDPVILDQNAVAAGIYKYMFAPYRLLLCALPMFYDTAQNARLYRSSENVPARSLHDLPLLNTEDKYCLNILEKIFTACVMAAPWLLTTLLLLYWIGRYWHAGIPGAKISFISFEAGVITGLLTLIPILAFSLVRSKVQTLQIFPGTFIALFFASLMIVFLFVPGNTAYSFPVRILMLILCACSFFYSDMDRTMLCCIALMAGVAAVCAGFSPRQYRMNGWFAGMAAACLLTPVLWYSKMYYPAAGIILCYILFAGYDNNKKAIRESGMASGADQD